MTPAPLDLASARNAFTFEPDRYEAVRGGGAPPWSGGSGWCWRVTPAGLPVEGGLRDTNYLILWRLRASPLCKHSVQWRDECLSGATDASGARCSVRLRVASSLHVFVAKPNDDGVVDVGLFSVHRPGFEEMDETEDL